MIRKQQNLGSKVSTGIRMEGSKGKNCFIKDHITRDVNTPFLDIQAFKAFMKRTIPQENTLFGTKLKLPRVVWAQIWPSSTSKSAQRLVVRYLFKQEFKRRETISNFRWETINQICGG